MEQQQQELNQHRNIRLLSGHHSYQREEQNTTYSSAGFVAVFQLWIGRRGIALVSIWKFNKHNNNLSYH